MPLISIVINCDTRPGAADPVYAVREQAASPGVCGVHSLDFLTAGVVAKNRFLASSGCERETILYVDQHDSIPHETRKTIDRLIDLEEITKLVVTPHSKHRSRWNDRLYLDALHHVSPHADYVAHFDGDCQGFRREGFDAAQAHIDLLASVPCKFVCQPSALTFAEHGMTHASTRFFFCRKADLDVPELERLVADDAYRAQRLPGQHLPCLEHIIGANVGGAACYPPPAYDDYCVFSWQTYHAGTLAKLNAMPYADVRRYVFDTCGGPLGPMDLIGKEIA